MAGARFDDDFATEQGAAYLVQLQTLFDRGNGLIYDAEQHITWMQDANYAFTSGFDGDGRLNWPTAVSWAENLSFAGFDDWRLPVVIQPDPNCEFQTDYGLPDIQGGGRFCMASEMSNLAHVQGIDADNPGPFNNLQQNLYWSGTEAGWAPTLAWNFDYRAAFLNKDPSTKDNSFVFVWAVRDGDADDIDDDGYPNAQDDFPDDPTEWLDGDGDGFGDNIDAFPTDPTESADTDSDGVGNNADLDDDADQLDDLIDSRAAGSHNTFCIRRQVAAFRHGAGEDMTLDC